MEIGQYYFADEVTSKDEDPMLINGHHINFYLKNSYIEDCKLNFFNLIIFRPKKIKSEQLALCLWSFKI
jgi:hypothetical protein